MCLNHDEVTIDLIFWIIVIRFITKLITQSVILKNIDIQVISKTLLNVFFAMQMYFCFVCFFVSFYYSISSMAELYPSSLTSCNKRVYWSNVFMHTIASGSYWTNFKDQQVIRMWKRKPKSEPKIKDMKTGLRKLNFGYKININNPFYGLYCKSNICHHILNIFPNHRKISYNYN